MVTQKLTIRLDETELPEIRMVSGDIGREIQIEVYAREDSENPINLESYSAEITLIKPDNTFIMDNFTIDKYELPEQAGAVSGKGYYQIKIFTAGTHQIYTGQGPFLVDDMILSDDVIESSSIAFGDRFPEDFATKTWVDEEIAHAELGTYVEGNPAGDPTEPDLVKLQINDDIFPIPVPDVPDTLDDLDDVEITSPTNGQAILYDDADDKWKNQDLPDVSVTKTATGNPIEITDAADAPMVRCVTEIQGYQSGSGTPSPDNIRPITAYTEGEIEVRGKNAINFSDFCVFSNWSTSEIPGSYGSSADNRTYKLDVDYGVSNVVSFGIDSETFPAYVGIGRTDGTTSEIVQRITTNAYRSDNCVFTAEAGYTYYVRMAAVNETEYNTQIGKITYAQLERGSTATPYEPYTSTTHTTTYPSAIYRGSEDVVNGEVVTEWKKAVFDGSEAWNASGTYPGAFYLYHADFDSAIKPNTAIICSDLLCNNGNNYSYGECRNDSNSISLFIAEPGTSLADFKAWLSNHNIEIAYELATPTTSPVTPTNPPVKSLLGFNRIESTTGDMEVEYITQTYQPLIPCHRYSTVEQVVGKWVDGSDVMEKTYIYTGTGAANPFSATIDMTGKNIIEVIPHYAKYTYGGGLVGYCAGSKLTESNSNVLKVEYDDATPPTVNVTSYLGSSTETYEIAFTIRYI